MRLKESHDMLVETHFHPRQTKYIFFHQKWKIKILKQMELVRNVLHMFDHLNQGLFFFFMNDCTSLLTMRVWLEWVIDWFGSFCIWLNEVVIWPLTWVGYNYKHQSAVIVLFYAFLPSDCFRGDRWSYCLQYDHTINGHLASINSLRLYLLEWKGKERTAFLHES